MKLPLVLEDCGTVRDAAGRVVISKINPCTLPERREIVRAVNVRKDMERKIAGQRAAIRALESTISQPHRGGAPDRGNPGGERPAARRRAQGVSRTGECR